jgi:hypothetical protein
MFGRSVFLIGAALAAFASVRLSAQATGHSDSPDAPLPAAPAVCQSPVARTVARQYIVKGRARPLLFWTSRREVGAAWFVSRASHDGERLELLIGTDPDRAPMRINRWGYVAETLCAESAELIGVMTESSEQTVEQAQTTTAATRDQQVFKAIRARASSSSVKTELLTVARPGEVTYRDLNSILDMLPARGARTESALPSGAQAGFLVAVTGLIEESVTSRRESGRMRTGLKRTYVYAGQLYDLTLDTSTITGAAPATIESEFQIRNRITGRTTDFRVAYVADGDGAGTPTRIVYRPRWWLELELQLQPAV